MNIPDLQKKIFITENSIEEHKAFLSTLESELSNHLLTLQHSQSYIERQRVFGLGVEIRGQIKITNRKIERLTTDLESYQKLLKSKKPFTF